MKGILNLLMLLLMSISALGKQDSRTDRSSFKHTLIARGSSTQASDSRGNRDRSLSPVPRANLPSIPSKSRSSPNIATVLGAPKPPATSMKETDLERLLSAHSINDPSNFRTSPPRNEPVAGRLESKAYLGPNGNPMLPLNELPVAMQRAVKYKLQSKRPVQTTEQRMLRLLGSSRTPASSAGRSSDPSTPFRTGYTDRNALSRKTKVPYPRQHSPLQNSQQARSTAGETRWTSTRSQKIDPEEGQRLRTTYASRWRAEQPIEQVKRDKSNQEINNEKSKPQRQTDRIQQTDSDISQIPRERRKSGSGSDPGQADQEMNSYSWDDSQEISPRPPRNSLESVNQSPR